MNDQEWEQAKERGKRTSPAAILAQEFENFFGSSPVVIAKMCPKCKIPFEIGLSLQGQEEDPNVRSEYTIYANSDLEFKRCLKCPKCGHSETL